MSYETCIQSIRKALGEELSEDDIGALISQLRIRREQRRVERPLESDISALARVAQELADEHKAEVAHAQRAQLINRTVAIGRRAEYERSGRDHFTTYKESLVGSDKPGVGRSRSTASEQVALVGKLWGDALNELQRKNVIGFVARADETMSREVAKDMWALSQGEKLTGRPESQVIARIYNELQEAARVMQNEVGANIDKLPGYIVTQGHNMLKMRRAGVDAWKTEITPKLAEKTFEGVTDREQFLTDIYNELSSGVFFRTPGDNKFERTLHFINSDAWFDYNKVFGLHNLHEQFFFGLRHAGNNTALMRRWGTNPTRAMESDRTYLQHKAAAEGDKKASDKFNSWTTDAYIQQLNGEALVPGNPTAAAVGAIGRAVINMVDLGGVVITTLPDIAIKASLLRHNGINYFEGIANGLVDFGRGRGTEEQRRIVQSLGVAVDAWRGAIMSRFSAPDSLPGNVAKVQNLFFRANLLSWETDSKALGAGLLLASNLGENQHVPFSVLDERLQATLSRYGVTEKEWGTLQKAELVTDSNGYKYLTPDGVKSLDVPESQKRELELALRTYYTDQVNAAMTQGGARERALLTGTTKPGSWPGEAMRFLMQYKMFPLTFYTRTMEREFSHRDYSGIALMIAGTTGMGALSLMIKDTLSNKTQRDWSKWENVAAAIKQGGGGGLYGDFLFSDYSRSTGALEQIAGPGFSNIAKVLSTLSSAERGEKVGGSIFNIIKSSTPFINLFYTKAALDYLILYSIQEKMNPGYMSRFESGMRKNTGQQFIFRPQL